jgi:hypothetical protein
MEQVARAYGFEPNRAGFIPCPFHQDKTGSLKIYPDTRGWHCFGCGIGGDVIDFVGKLLNLSFPDAMDRLNSDFGLGLGDILPPPEELAKRRRAAEIKQKKLDAYRAYYDKACTLHRRLWLAKQAGPDHPNYVEACLRLDYIQYWFDIHHWR